MSEIPATADAIARGEACCVCGQTGATVWRRAPDNLLGGPDIYTAVKCGTCGTVRLSPRPDAETMKRAYSPQTYARAEQGANESGGLATSGLAKRLDVFFDHQAQRAVDAFARLADPSVPRRVLDVGCGDGRFLQAMSRRGWDGVGLETDPHAAALARERAAPLGVHESPLETAGLPAGSFGMVSLLHVLEHVPDPRETLGNAYEMLAPGGVLLLALPNAESLEARLFGAEWYQLDLPRHFWGFGPQTLGRLVQEVGFTRPSFRFLPFFSCCKVCETGSAGNGTVRSLTRLSPKPLAQTHQRTVPRKPLLLPPCWFLGKRWDVFCPAKSWNLLRFARPTCPTLKRL